MHTSKRPDENAQNARLLKVLKKQITDAGERQDQEELYRAYTLAIIVAPNDRPVYQLTILAAEKCKNPALACKVNKKTQEKGVFLHEEKPNNRYPPMKKKSATSTTSQPQGHINQAHFFKKNIPQLFQAFN